MTRGGAMGIFFRLLDQTCQQRSYSCGQQGGVNAKPAQVSCRLEASRRFARKSSAVSFACRRKPFGCVINKRGGSTRVSQARAHHNGPQHGSPAWKLPPPRNISRISRRFSPLLFSRLLHRQRKSAPSLSGNSPSSTERIRRKESHGESC